MILCRALGPLEVTVDGAMASGDLRWRKPLALLVYLARSGPRGRTREQLAALLWPDHLDADARHSLNEALRTLRHHAGKTAIDSSGTQVRFTPGAVRLDVDDLAELADRGDWAGAAALVTGEFLEGFAVPDASAFEDWLAAERAEWRDRSVAVLINRVEELLREGAAQDATAVARRALALDPRSEPAARAAMRSLALAGDRAAALECYDRFAKRLAEELSAVPAAEITALADRVRRQRLARPTEHHNGADQVDLTPRLPLAGREMELRRLLDTSFAAAAAQRAALLVIEGESGAGKTRLLAELLARLQLDGWTVAAARAVESDRTEPWSGMLVLARSGLAEVPGVSGASPAAIAALAEAAPDWAGRFPGVVRGAAPVPLGRAVSELVRAAADERPVVLAVDDAQWLDVESTVALSGLLRDLAAAPVCLALSLAPLPARQELDELRSRVGRDLPGCVVGVGALSADALRALAGRLLPAYDAVELDRVVRRVGSDSAGFPLLAVEILRAVAAGLDLQHTPSAWPAPDKTLDQTLPGDLPDAVVAAIRMGYRRLSPDAQRVLTTVAVLADRVSPARVATALSLPIETVHQALDELEWHHWLVAEPRGYGFVAALVRRVIERDMLTPGQLRRLREADSRA
jgi:DNA-binding SARP family transcriptional activator